MEFRLRNVVVMCAAWACVSASQAIPPNMTAGEIARLPEYCVDTFSFTKQWAQYSPTPRQARWEGLMGKTFWSIHHYCWGLIIANRTGRIGLNPQERDGMFASAIAEIYYVIGEAPPDWVLLPEMYTRAGEYFARRGRYIEAVEHQERAIALKADYWPPYVALIDLHISYKRRSLAEKVLQEGVNNLTERTQLLAAAKRAGLPIPAPTRAPAAPTPVSTASAEPAASSPGAAPNAAESASSPR